MAPEEVEALITFPLETAFNGASGVMAVRSSSGSGLSVIYVEFDWDTDIYNDRQVVNERLQLVAEQLPEGVNPTLAPLSSIMGQISMYGMWSEGEKTPSMEVRTLADWVVRQRLLAIPGVAQVFTMGGGRMQFQVLVDPDALRNFGLTIHEVREAVEAANLNATGGYLDQRGANELLVRGIGRVKTLDDLQKDNVDGSGGRPVTLDQIARVAQAPQVKRGDSSAFVRTSVGHGRRWAGGRADDQQATGRDTRAVDQADQRGARRSSRLVARRHSHCQRLFATIVHRSSDRERRRGACRWRRPGRGHPVFVLVEFPHHVHHADGDPAFDRRHRLRVRRLWAFDQHDDAGRIGGCDRRIGR